MPEGKEVEFTDEMLNEQNIGKTAKEHFLKVLNPDKNPDPDATENMLKVRAEIVKNITRILNERKKTTQPQPKTDWITDRPPFDKYS